jgi:hypothetical protein
MTYPQFQNVSNSESPDVMFYSGGPEGLHVSLQDFGHHDMYVIYSFMIYLMKLSVAHNVYVYRD